MNLAFTTRLPRIGRSLAALALFGSAALVAPQSGMASTVTFTAPSITVPESATTTTYTADVLISDTNTSDILAGYQLDLFLQPTSIFNPATPGLPNDTNIAYGSSTGFDFNTTTVTNGSAVSYVYNNSNPGNQNNSNDINFASPGYLGNYTSSLQGPSTANEIYPSDTYANSDVATLNATWALARVFITVAGGFSGKEYLVWNNNGIGNDPDAPYYQLSTAPTNSLDPNLVAGVITVVPEPGSVVLMMLGAVGLFGFGFRRMQTSNG